jgi:hypothetical protein
MNRSYYNCFIPQKAIMPIACAAIFLAILGGCKKSDSSHQALGAPTPDESNSSNLSFQSILNSISSASDALAPHAESLEETTKEEVTKLFRWEYKVIDLDILLSAPAVADTLNELGNDNWECSTGTPVPQTIRFYCKRRPRGALSYLRFVR